MKRKIKRVTLLGITYTELILAALAGCAMDSPDLTVPLIVLAQAVAWIALFIKANPEWASQEGRKGCIRKFTPRS